MLLPGCSAGSGDLAQSRQRSAVHPTQVVRDLHEAHAEHLELAGQFDRRILAGQRLEIIVARDERQFRAFREMPRHGRAEFRPGVDARADRGAALRQLEQAREHGLEAHRALVDLRAPTGKFLRHRNGHRIHQMGSAGLDHIAEVIRAPCEHLAQALERRQQMLGEQQCRTEVNRRRHHVVAALSHVHMIVRMHRHPERTGRKRRDHLVGVHVAAGAGAGLKHIDRELIVVAALGDFQRRGLHRERHRLGQIAQLVVGGRGGMLDEPQRAYEGARHLEAARRKILNRPLGLCAPEGGRRHVERAHTVVLDARCGGHRALLRRIWVVYGNIAM